MRFLVPCRVPYARDKVMDEEYSYLIVHRIVDVMMEETPCFARYLCESNCDRYMYVSFDGNRPNQH